MNIEMKVFPKVFIVVFLPTIYGSIARMRSFKLIWLKENSKWSKKELI